MEAKTSKKQTRPTAQISKKIAKGKRKEESLKSVVSLQDVFSESANAFGSYRKTSRLFESEHGKRTQLEKKK